MDGFWKSGCGIPETRVSITLLNCPVSNLGCSKNDFGEIIKPTNAKPIEIVDFSYAPEGYSVGALMMEDPTKYKSPLERKVAENVRTLTATCEKSACNLHIYPDLKAVTGEFYLCYDSKPLLAIPPFIEKFNGTEGDFLYHTSFFSNACLDSKSLKKVISYLDSRFETVLPYLDAQNHITAYKGVVKWFVFKKVSSD